MNQEYANLPESNVSCVALVILCVCVCVCVYVCVCVFIFAVVSQMFVWLCAGILHV